MGTRCVHIHVRVGPGAVLELGGGPSLRHLFFVFLLLIFDQKVGDVDADEVALRDLVVQDTHGAEDVEQL